ncbi:hypothetical protein, partial [Shinella sp.]|uniref:SMa0974 family conjugal transfer regulator n=1 Tax=Shinella sp. TaxID=1870904 RepID=UPI0029ACFA3A
GRLEHGSILNGNIRPRRVSSQWQSTVDQLCARCCAYCLSIGEDSVDRLLTFEDVCATLRPANGGLRMRVEGRDPVSFYGVRMLLQGQLGIVTAIATMAIEWYAVDCSRKRKEVLFHEPAMRDDEA